MMSPARHLAAVGEQSTSVMTNWLYRQADNARFAYEVVNLYGHNPAITVGVLHKNREDLGVGEALSVSWADVGGGFVSGVAVGLKEMIRFVVTLELQDVEKEDDFGGGSYRMLRPTWFDQASDAGP